MPVRIEKIDEEDGKYVLGTYLASTTNSISINVYDIWSVAKRDKRVKKKNLEDYFIKKFANVVAHEYIHSEINGVLDSLYNEEKIVDKLVGKI